MSEIAASAVPPHRISIVIPVYQGEKTLDGVIGEILALPTDWTSPAGHPLRVDEILLVWDRGPDQSDAVIRRLVTQHPRVRAIWLSRNFGQHAASLAGMASSGGDWVVTMDEDGQHDPRSIAEMLDVAMAKNISVVYAEPTNPAPHGVLRNAASRGAKRVASSMTGGSAGHYQSFRLVLGEIARSVAAYSGAGIYLDVALGWVAGGVGTCPVALRREQDRPSGYSLRSLLSHFWRMVVSSGTRGLRVVSVVGIVFAMLGLGLAAALLVEVATGTQPTVRGWASTMVAILVTSGAVLMSLGVIAEYVGAAVNMAMGKPLYLIVSDPAIGPLGRRSHQ